MSDHNTIYFIATIIMSHINAIDNNHNTSVLPNNMIIMDVGELHPAWPTYVVDVNPENPGPLVSRLVIFNKMHTK
jgi:hypothetical protein